MGRTLGAILDQRALTPFVGREGELAALDALLHAGGPRVIHLSGAAGVGKSLLAGVFAARARDARATVIDLDCRVVEPSLPGLLGALAEATGADEPSLTAVCARLALLGERIVLILDGYEHFWLMDTFIRRELCPLLPDTAALLLVGREGPVGAWLTALEWRGLFQSIVLGPLTERSALAYLRSVGLDEAAARRVNAVARGHPLAIAVAAGLRRTFGAGRPEDAAAGAIVDYVAQEYLALIDDPATREALEAACVVRRVTESVLRALLPHAAPRDTLTRLRRLPFVESAADGLFVHEAVRDALATALKTSDPVRYRAYRIAAWHQLRNEVKHAPRAELWRYTADILYLLQNPLLREAFFPSGYQPLAVEPALARDEPAIRAITARHDEEESAAAMAAWWERHPEAFRVCRDGQGATIGFGIVLPGASVSEDILTADPVTAAWADDMRRAGGGRSSLFIRRLLDSERGEEDSASKAAFGLGVKRTYMEMRPNLRYIYVGGVDARSLDWSGPLGFVAIAGEQPQLDGRPFLGRRLDMGPGSVEGWLARVVADELGIPETERRTTIFDPEAQELMLPSGRVGLTPLEHGVISVLYERAGRPVSRADLLERVWGCDASAASNVVDAIVLAIRRKLGDHAATIETVRGVGYRYRA